MPHDLLDEDSSLRAPGVPTVDLARTMRRHMVLLALTLAIVVLPNLVMLVADVLL